MIRFPTQLRFDESGSAAIRLFGTQVADVKLHWRQGVRQNLLACPEDIGLLGFRCSGCVDDVPGSMRTVATGGDLNRQRWCVLISHADVVKRIFEASLSETGGVPEITRRGMGPDVVLQVVSGHTFVETIGSTTGLPRGNGERPQLEDFLRGMESRSAWKLV